MQIFHFTVRGMPNYGRERVFSFHFENQKFPNNYFGQIKSKDKKHIPNSFFFLKAIRWVRVSFPKRKTTSTLHAYAIYFFDFSLKHRYI